MGGGIGIPPMLQLAKELQADKQIILGYRNQDLFLAEELRQNGTVYIATEDGSVGCRGNVMDAIRENGLKAEVIMACTPAIVTFVFIRYPPLLLQIPDHPYKCAHCAHANDGPPPLSYRHSVQL